MILEAKNTHQVELLKTSKIASKLYAKHINTELYKKIVESLDQDHPDWRKNSQLGRCAPHLINFVIRFCSRME
ncbi:hypothetical protein ACT3CE_14550 [Marinifilum sp. RC60d5]|uniref:hypothetical protein n=1 Tax=Marinifilum sp. RC60d5 TaxID=3458414 RepID=UPI004036902C